jgi:TonB-linked SusC/RagA family outer membrane protein
MKQKSILKNLAALYIVMLLSWGVSNAQTFTVRGQVSTDDNANGTTGVSVGVQGTTNGTVTLTNGHYQLSGISPTDSLVFSFIGYRRQIVAVNNRTVINIKLSAKVSALNQVVVVGYGTQREATVVGAVSQVAGSQLEHSANVPDLTEALTGQIPGLTTITANGEPGGTGNGGGTQIYIRGQNTWNGGQPLVLVDGVERSMANVDVNSVASISVLKDASATAVYGVEGANGVILITTKRGFVGKPKLSFSYSTTALSVSKLPKVENSYDALMTLNESIEREAGINPASWGDYTPYDIVKRYKAPQTPENALIYPNVDWQKAMFKDFSISHRATLDVQGGSNLVKYFGSIAYLHEGDMFRNYDNGKGYKPNYNFNRLNFRSNLDFKITKTTDLSVDLSGYYSQKNTNWSYRTVSNPDGINPDAWAAVYGMPPNAYLPQYPDGRWGYSSLLPVEALPNPVASLNNIGIREDRETELNSEFELKQNLDFITDGLSAKVSFAYDNSILSEGGIYDLNNAIKPGENSNTPLEEINRDLYTGPEQDPSEYTTFLPLQGKGLFDWVRSPLSFRPDEILPGNTLRRTMYQLQINYTHSFNLNNVGATGVFKRREDATGSEFKHFREDWVGRVTYNYDTRYLLEMNGAYNGSEQFGPGHRFGFFPSVGVGWNVSREKFFQIEWINSLKLRASSGLVGNDNSPGRWLYASQYAFGGAGQLDQNPYGLSPYTWYTQSVLGNPDIHWEKALKKDFGVDISLFNNILSATFDYFTEHRTQMLIAGTSQGNVPSYFGAPPPTLNEGAVSSHGQEIEVRFDKVSGKFHYWATFSFSHTQNKVLDEADPPLLPNYQKAAGFPIGQTRTEVRAGFYNNWDEVYASVPYETNDQQKLPGGYNILDFNGDGEITSSGDNIPYRYSKVPQNTYNFSTGADFGGLSLMVQLYAVDRATRIVNLKVFNQFQPVVFGQFADYWSKDNENAPAYLPRWKAQGQNVGDFFVYDAASLRIQTAEVAYTFRDKKWLKKAGLSSFKLFLNGQNLTFWSALPDDRETNDSGGSGADGSYPLSKRFNLGVNLNF